MKDFVKYLLFGSLIFLFIGCSKNIIIGESCKKKFKKKNIAITQLYYPKGIDTSFGSRRTKATVALNNEADKECVLGEYKLKGERAYQTICGEHIFRGINARYNKNIMSIDKVVDKNGNEYPLKLVSSKIKIKCEENFLPGIAKEIDSYERKYKVRANPTSDNSIKPEFLENRFYVKKVEVESLYRLPKTPNF
tara:strand:- start:52 stop:630 length:579 start_codon:yes stop_codon:yes gene_type:complete